jgi:hypothetical protein
LEVGLDTPAVPAECAADADCAAAAAGGLDVEYEVVSDNATPGNTSDDVVLGTDSQTGVPFDSYTSTTVDLTGVPDGAGIEARVTVTGTDSEGTEHSVEGSAGYVYEGEVTDRAVVDACYVNGSHVGTGLAMQCNAHDPLGRSLIGSWTLTTDLDGAIIADLSISSSQIAAPALGAEDVGLHTYTVTVLDSDDYTFTVPVDEHYSTLTLHCSDGTNHDLLLPETSVDAVAEDCGTGFNPTLKPAALGQPDYVLDVDAACVPAAISSLPAAELEAHEHYNNGTTVSDILCALDFAQVRYEHQ